MEIEEKLKKFRNDNQNLTNTASSTSSTFSKYLDYFTNGFASNQEVKKNKLDETSDSKLFTKNFKDKKCTVVLTKNAKIKLRNDELLQRKIKLKNEDDTDNDDNDEFNNVPLLINKEPESESTQVLTYEEKRIYYLNLALKFFAWASLYALFIKIEFGVVYLIVSILIFIFLNTGVGKKGRISAYSVFNPKFARLQGTITAEDLQKNMMGM